MKIALIGGGSALWASRLVADMSSNETLQGATVILQDIDATTLEISSRACRRMVAELKSHLKIITTLERPEALYDADFVILCVSIGGLAARENDLEIPARYGVYQSVGDTVGPGGLARGLRHIPFAVQLAHEMEESCPNAWLLNLSNPLTTICRSIIRASKIRTVGFCHQAESFCRRHLAPLFQVPEDRISFDAVGINHLPVISRLSIGKKDGFSLLRNWLTEHSAFEFIDQHESDVHDVFKDRLAVKLSLFEEQGILFGAADRHIAEFFPGFLTDSTERGKRYGVVLTTIEHRKELARQWQTKSEQFIQGGQVEEFVRPARELAPLMAALTGGPAGRFVVNVPNEGQIENLPRGAVVECMADVDSRGIRALPLGKLPARVHEVIAPHVIRQEFIVEAALTGDYDIALAALATDPLIPHPRVVKPLFEELVAANDEFMFDV